MHPVSLSLLPYEKDHRAVTSNIPGDGQRQGNRRLTYSLKTFVFSRNELQNCSWYRNKKSTQASAVTIPQHLQRTFHALLHDAHYRAEPDVTARSTAKGPLERALPILPIVTAKLPMLPLISQALAHLIRAVDFRVPLCPPRPLPQHQPHRRRRLLGHNVDDTRRPSRRRTRRTASLPLACAFSPAAYRRLVCRPIPGPSFLVAPESHRLRGSSCGRDAEQRILRTLKTHNAKTRWEYTPPS